MLQYNNSTPNQPSTPKSASSQSQAVPLDISRVLKGIPKDDHEGLIVFFEKPGEQYEAYGFSADALNVLLSRCPLTSTSDGQPKCSFNLAQFRSCLKELFAVSGWRRIEIWDYSPVKKAWRCGKSASPGNSEEMDCIFQDQDGTTMEFGLSSVPVVVSLVASQGRIGVAFANTTEFTLGLAEFADNELLSNTEVALIQLGALECITPASGLYAEKIKEICRNCGIAFTPVKPSEFTEECQDDLSKLMADEQFGATQHPVAALKAAGGLVQYLRLLHSDSNLKAFKLASYDLDAYLKLDDTALRSLHIFDSPTGPKAASLFSLLDKCKTSQGSRLLDQWLRQPLRSSEAIEARLDVVEAFVDGASARQSLRENCLRAVPDLSRIAKRLVRSSSNLQDIVVLYQAIQKIEGLMQELASLSDHQHGQQIKRRYIDGLSVLRDGLAKFSEMVESMLDFSALERHEYIVRADFNEDLLEISAQKDEILAIIEPEFARVARKIGLEMNKKVKLERNNLYGYFFRVSRIDYGNIKDDEFQELATQKNGVYFVTPLLRESSIRYDELCRLYAAKQSVIVKEMLATAATYRTLFDQWNLLIADLDVCLSLAYVSVMSPKSFVRPSIGGPSLVLKEARHPCIEGLVDFIANDVEFTRDCGHVQLITGPNMSGKSTYIRQAALIVIMAQIGCFVPCSEARVPIFDSVMVRVGAGDSIMRGVSTFMAEMLETASILRTASKDSFVIIDELGRGTSTSEGLGLAWGVTKYIANHIGCFTFFATHFFELTVLANEMPQAIRNLHVTAQVFEGSLTMLYTVKPGVCDQSFGINVAELANFPPVVVEMAKLRTAELEGRPLLQFGSEEEQQSSTAWIQQALSLMHQIPAEERKAGLHQLLSSAPSALKTIFSKATP